MKELPAHRVFFALWPDPEAASHLSALADSLAGNGGRVIRPESLHLTLAFVGATAPDRIAELEHIAAGIRGTAFELSLDRLGFWPQGGILWAGCRQTPAPLRDLADRLATELRAAGFDPHRQAGSALVPHVTLARRVRCPALPRLGSPINWTVDAFELLESQLHPRAARYAPLAAFALDTAAAPCN